jgi:hypothetical protein
LRDLQRGFYGLKGGFLLGELATAFEGEAEEQDEDAPDAPACEVPEEGREHGGVHARVGAAAEDRSGVLGAPPADGHVDDRDIDGGEDGEDCGEGLGLASRGETTQHEVADVEEPEQKHAGEAGIPCPPDAPGYAPPDRAGDEGDAGVDDGYLRGGEGEGVGGEGLEGVSIAPVEIGKGGGEVEVGEEQAPHCGGDVIVEDASDVALGRIGGDEEYGFAEADDEHCDGDGEPEPGDAAESGAALCHGFILSRMRCRRWLFGVRVMGQFEMLRSW